MVKSYYIYRLNKPESEEIMKKKHLSILCAALMSIITFSALFIGLSVPASAASYTKKADTVYDSKDNRDEYNTSSEEETNSLYFYTWSGIGEFTTTYTGAEIQTGVSVEYYTFSPSISLSPDGTVWTLTSPLTSENNSEAQTDDQTIDVNIGCSSSVGGGAVIFSAIAVCGVLLKRKKPD